MTIAKESIHSSDERLHSQYDNLIENTSTSPKHLEDEYHEELVDIQSQIFWYGHRVPTPATENPAESTQTTSEYFEKRMSEFERKIQVAVDIGLENRKILERLLQDDEDRIGIGAIHSLDQGRVQLNSPLFYRYQVIDDEVVVSIEDLEVYGVGLTERDAVREVEEELWSIFQDLDQTPPEEIGTSLARILRTIRARIQ